MMKKPRVIRALFIGSAIFFLLTLFTSTGSLKEPKQLRTALVRSPIPATIVLKETGESPNNRQVIENYGKLPLLFEANQGQADAQVRFVSRGAGYNLYLTPTEAVLTLRKEKAKARTSRNQLAEHGLVSALDLRGRPGKVSAPAEEKTTVRMQLVGGNAKTEVAGVEQQSARVNYFIGNDPKKWHTGVPMYGRVQYADVYPGVDLAYHGEQRQLEYDFVIKPGADLNQIRLVFEGAKKIRIDESGDLVLSTKGGDVRQHKPIVYQEIAGRRREIPGNYVVKAHREIGFEVGSYDRSQPLVIDPVLSYSTYLGGADSDVAYGIAVDSAGNAYVTGETGSINFPTLNAYQSSIGNGGQAGETDVFVIKLTTSGGVSYSTYLGGNVSGSSRIADGGRAIAVDSAGNAYITGETYTTNFPTMNAYQPSNGGGNATDAFVSKLTASGGLSYSTYLGGNGSDFGLGIAVDLAGNFYVTGITGANNFPTLNASQPGFGGETRDAFVTKFTALGELGYSTYLGGNDYDFGQGIAVDSASNAYVTGYTFSTNFPTLSAYQPSHASGAVDVFVTKLTPIGGLGYSTYLGGTGTEIGQGIGVDSTGAAYVTGYTFSLDFPTLNAYQSNHASDSGSADAFVTKLTFAGGLGYSTYLGGNSSDQGYGVAADLAGNAYVTGQTSSTDFPTMNASQANNMGGSDAFITKLNTSGGLSYSTYLGSNDVDFGQGIAVDGSGNAYVTGKASSSGFPTLNAYQSDYGGNVDAFVTKIVEDPCPSNLSIGGSVPDFCEATNQAISLSASGSGLSGATITWSLDGATLLGTGLNLSSNLIGLSAGPHTITTTASKSGCPDVSASTSFTVSTKPMVSISGAPTASIRPWIVINLTANVSPMSGALTFLWTRNGSPFSTASAISDSPSVGSYTYQVTVTRDGCASSAAEVTITVGRRGTFAVVTSQINDGLGKATVVDLTVQPPVSVAEITGLGQAFDVAITADGACALVTSGFGSNNTVAVIDLTAAPPTVLATLHVGRTPTGISISPNGALAVVSNYDDRTISIIDLTANPPIVNAMVPVGIGLSGSPFDVVIAADSKHAVVAFGDGAVGQALVVDLTPPTPTEIVAARIGIGRFPIGIRANADRSLAIVTSISQDNVTILDLTAFPFSKKATVDIGRNPGSKPDISSNGLAVVANSDNDNVSIIDVLSTTPSVVATVPVGGGPRGVAVFDSDNAALIANRDDGTLSRVDLSNFTSVPVLLSGISQANHIDIYEGPNQAPLADAGPNQTKDEGSLVTLDGSGSSDPDDDPLTFQWIQITGPTVALSNPASVQTTFIAPNVPAAGATLTFKLTVRDGIAVKTDTVDVAIVHDSIAPVPDVGSLPTVTGECGASVTAPTATDNLAGQITGTTTDPTSYSAQGTFIVHWTYNDGRGNTSGQTQTVIVQDTIAPIIPVLADVTGECSATASFPTTMDNCSGTIIGTTSDSLTYSTQGTHVIHWSFDDGHGNVSSASQNVVIHDATVPVPNVATLPTVTGQCSANITSPPSATDNCAGHITGATSDPTSFTSQGTFTIHWIYNDGNGNTSTQMQTVIVHQTAMTSDAGPDQSLCETATATLAVNTPTVGTGTWTLVTGAGTITSANSANTLVTGLGYGANIFRWTITNESCAPLTDEVTITRYQTPTTANAGLDQVFCDLSTATLAGNSPVVGAGQWLLVSGSATITNPNNPTTSVTGLGFGPNTFRWTITNGSCASMDDVVITRNTCPSSITLFSSRDSFLRSGADDTNEGANERLRVQNAGDNRAVVGFDLNGISTVGLQSATLVLTIAENSNNWGNSGRPVDVQRLLADWTEGNGRNDIMVGGGAGFRGTGEGATWHCGKDTNIVNQKANCNPQWNGGSYAAATAPAVLHTNGLLGQVSWDVTADISAGANFGWVIRKQNEGQNGQVRYYSKEGAALAGDASLAPRLVLVYAPVPPAPSNRAYVTNYGDNNVSVIDTVTNTVVATVPVGYGDNPYFVALNPAGTRAYVTNSASTTVSVIDTATNTVVATVTGLSAPNSVAVNSAGTRVYVINYGTSTVSVIDAATNIIVATVPVGSGPGGLAVNPAGTLAYARSGTFVSVIDTTTNTIVATVTVGSGGGGLAVNPTGTRAYVANSLSNTVSVIHTSTNTVVATVPVGVQPWMVAINPAGTRAYVVNYADSTVSVIDTATNTAVATVPVGSHPYDVAVNPAGTRAYVPNISSNNVSVIDTATNTVVATVSVGLNPTGVAVK